MYSLHFDSVQGHIQIGGYLIDFNRLTLVQHCGLAVFNALLPFLLPLGLLLLEPDFVFETSEVVEEHFAGVGPEDD